MEKKDADDLKCLQKIEKEINEGMKGCGNIQDVANEAVRHSTNGYELGEYGYPIAIPKGNYILMFPYGHTDSYKKIKE